MENQLNRRKFILTSATALTGISAMGFPSLAGKTWSSSDSPLKVGLIGCGSRGIGLAMILKELPEYQLIACCDIIPDTAIAVHMGNNAMEEGNFQFWDSSYST